MKPSFTVLVVEDNEVNLELMRSIIRMNGCHPLSACSSKEGIEKARTAKPDLIFLDIQLPDGDGLETAREIRKYLGPEVPIAVLTAHALNEYQVRAAEVQCQYFITKPPSLSTIESVISEARSRKTSD